MQNNLEKIGYFDKKIPKKFWRFKKKHYLCTRKTEQGCSEWQLTLGYGVMVTLQILVLSFLVRVRVPQLKKSLSRLE